MVSKAQIKRLRLQDGDIVVVRNPEDAKALVLAGRGTKLNCPIVVAQGSIHRLDKAYLRKLLAE